MARKKPTATQRLRRNVKRTIKSFEKRGYIVSDEIKKKIDTAPYQTLKSYQRDGYRRLYEESTAIVNGQTVSGRRYRNIEREQAAQKAAQTKKAKQSQVPEPPTIDNIPNEGEIVYYNLLNLIAENPGAGGDHLRLILDAQIAEYGKEAVIRSLANAPEEAIEAAQKVVHYREYSEEEVSSATNELVRILSGEKPSREDLEQDYEGIYDFE